MKAQDTNVSCAFCRPCGDRCQTDFPYFFTAAFPDWKKVHISLFLFSQRKAQKGFTGMGQYCKIDTK
ncbi:MAG TPA: hypothetical protein DEP43_00865 [Ruminococcaceae bacterium]|nr:hypothetical protein [Oscillospiraceae bacterium]HCU33771.1 hypothetical protein [Oscillospiraceae bacterium]